MRLSLTAAVALALAAVAAHYRSPAWAAFEAAEAEDGRLGEAAGDQRRDAAFGDAVGRRVADGTLTLAEAADLLEPHLRGRDAFGEAWRTVYRVPSFRLGVARYAVIRALDGPDGDPQRRAEVAARLAAEYAELEAAERGETEGATE